MRRGRSALPFALSVASFGAQAATAPSPPDPLLTTHCATCHGESDPQSGFSITSLSEPGPGDAERWHKALTYVEAGVMPPPGATVLLPPDRRRVISLLQEGLLKSEGRTPFRPALPRRLNNRELANSLRDVLLIEDVGTHQPLADLVGDTLERGFDTNGDALGMSQFHLEQYISAFRRVLNATIFDGPRPPVRRYAVAAADMRLTSLSQTQRAERANRTDESIDFLDPRLRVYFSNFERTPATGRYRVKIRATGKDRRLYEASETGVYHGDPIRVAVHLGDRQRVFELPDESPAEIELDEWIAEGTRLEISYPTDGLRFRGNGNFKFQFSIAHDHILSSDPDLHAAILADVLPRAPQRTVGNPRHWSHWTDHWQGPRPRLFSAEIEGPLFESWPPRRQVALLGESPVPDHATAILLPIARRAWRRDVQPEELEPFARMVAARASENGPGGSAVEALKEGILGVLASPSFLLVNTGQGTAADRFAAKLSYFLRGSIPDEHLRTAAKSGNLATFQSVRAEVSRQLAAGAADEFLREFPAAWLELDRINFMAPDPDRYPFYTRKRLGEDMVSEVLRFFRHVVDNNLPVTELLAADYTFLNADLARIYGVNGVPQDSRLRKHTFADGRRGGLLGMGAFLTLTADTLSTSPIHRAVFVLEKFLGIHPAPPPPDVEITEPDIRQAKTVKEVLASHVADPTCASCHQAIDPYGYAFENFGPTGAWRDAYTAHIAPRPSRKELLEFEERDRLQVARGLPPMQRPWDQSPIPVDASARFPNGSEYRDISDFRRHLLSPGNRESFVRCFIEKLLTYANGTVPAVTPMLDAIFDRSASSGHRIIDTISAVVDSSLFRDNLSRASGAPE